MNTNEPMTEYGYEKLRNELNDLTKVQRPQIVKEIDVARSYGDLKENAEYHAAREKQAFIEARIGELSLLMEKAVIVNPAEFNHDKVRFGSCVTLEDAQSEENFTYTIVGVTESNIEKGLISIKSPLAQAMLGKEEGDEVKLKTTNPPKEYEIIQICFKEIVFD